MCGRLRQAVACTFRRTTCVRACATWQELLDAYADAKDSAGVVAVQQRWLDAGGDKAPIPSRRAVDSSDGEDGAHDNGDDDDDDDDDGSDGHEDSRGRVPGLTYGIVPRARVCVSVCWG
jgi:hypothetical protein